MEYVNQELPKKGDTVVVGMSGGVDSTLVALMLKNKGCHVIGATMALWDGSLPEVKSDKPIRESCYGPGEEDNIEECQRFCKEYDIEYHVIDVKEQYRKEVLEYFKREYRAGRTPNPCIQCNRAIKFGALLEGINKLGIDYDYFCTGHYARIVKPEEGIFGTDEKPYMIACAMDVSKDQTYFLNRIPSSVLSKVRFPLALMKKSEVKALANEAHLEAAKREESQDFIGEEYFDMLFSDVPSKPGDIVDLDGHVLGKHRGIEHYTVGQRRGLGVAVNYPVYVHSIDAKNNIVVLAPNDALNSDGLVADDFVWAGGVEPKDSIEAMVKIRLASKPVKAIIERYDPTTDGKDGSRDTYDYVGTPWKVTFESPQRAVAPGQSVVLYDNGVMLGGGFISKTINNDK